MSSMSSEFKKTSEVTGSWVAANGHQLGVYNERNKETVDICSWSEKAMKVTNGYPEYAVSIGTNSIKLQTLVNGTPVTTELDPAKFEAAFRSFLAGAQELTR